MNWKASDKLNKTGHILALCQDETGIYNQIMTVVVEGSKRTFYENGFLGSSVRVFPAKIKAGLYLDEVCPESVIKEFTTMDEVLK